MNTLAKRHNALASRRLAFLRRHTPQPAASDISIRDRFQVGFTYLLSQDINGERRRKVFYLRQLGII